MKILYLSQGQVEEKLLDIKLLYLNDYSTLETLISLRGTQNHATKKEDGGEGRVVGYVCISRLYTSIRIANVQLETGGSVQFSSVAQSCLILCDPMNRSTPGLPVHHQLLEFTQTHVHRVSDAIQASHPLSSPSPPAPNPSQHQGLFQ